jgi:hypothetical protein
MAQVMTYNSLVDNIQVYLERTDAQTISYIPTFIMLAEQVLASQMKFLGNLYVAESAMVANTAIIAKPTDWHKTVSMNITVNGTSQPVLLRKYEYLKEYTPNATTGTGAPLYYCDYDYSHWFVAPTPDQAYSFEVLYYQRVQPLDVSNQTNWYTQYAPQAILFGSLLQAMPYLKNDPRVTMWQQQYDLIVSTLMNEDKLRVADRQAVAVDS